MPTSLTYRQERAVRDLLRDAIRSGVEPDQRDLDELRRLGIPVATLNQISQLADVAVEKFESGETLSLNEANKFADKMAEQLTEPLRDRNNVETADRELADQLYAGRFMRTDHTARRRDARIAEPVPWKQ